MNRFTVAKEPNVMVAVGVVGGDSDRTTPKAVVANSASDAAVTGVRSMARRVLPDAVPNDRSVVKDA